MRELTIRRISGRLFHPCSAEFWLEDPAAAQQEIEGVGCRLLGTVEPEEEKSFWIPKTEVTVFVRMDWHGQIITAGSLTVPEGEDAVACTAKDQMLPGQSRSVVLSIAGSGVERKVMDQYQKAERVRKIVLVFSILAGIGIGLFFASRRPPTPKTITFDADGLQLTLSSSFQESGDRAEGFSRAYYSNDSAVQVARYPFSEADGMTLRNLQRPRQSGLRRMAGSSLQTRSSHSASSTRSPQTTEMPIPILRRSTSGRTPSGSCAMTARRTTIPKSMWSTWRAQPP